MTDLTDFLNVVASSEDWTAAGADDPTPPKLCFLAPNCA
jgi:hypothetical protein